MINELLTFFKKNFNLIQSKVKTSFLGISSYYKKFKNFFTIKEKDNEMDFNIDN